MTHFWFGAAAFGRRRARLTAFGALLLAAAAPVARAQDDRTPKQGLPGEPAAAAPSQAGRGFRLFSIGELAGTGMKMTGQMSWGLTNLGPCADGITIFAAGAGQAYCGAVQVGSILRTQWYDISLAAGAGIYEFRKIAGQHPAIRDNILGPTYTHLFNQTTVNARAEFGPSDGQAQRGLFRGAENAAGAGCRDNTSVLNALMEPKVTLLAGSSCPETWGAQGFQGPRPISDSAFIRLAQRNPSGFNWQYWRIPELDKDQSKFLGDFSTYGEISDHYSEMLDAYGGVTKLRSGKAQIGGFPLGLDMHFEAFSFARPAIQNAVFWQMTVVNRSDRLYGTGVNYDSLYMGLEFSIGSRQTSAVYFVPSRNAMLSPENGSSGPTCNGAITTDVTFCGGTGFTRGARGIIMLKSPIGDTRNKLFTREGTPFYSLRNTVPKAILDDTITFNHGSSCNYGGSCSFQTSYANDRRGFGMVSSTAENVLDGRQLNDLGTSEYWYTFKNKWFPERQAKFSYFVPGTSVQNSREPHPGQPYGEWDYDNDDKQDTLWLETCADRGCVTTYADTMPNKRAVYRANDAAHMTAGPFKLKIGDTVSFIYAFIGAPDSSSFEALTNAVTNSYLEFFVGCEPAPPPRIVASQTEVGSVGDPNTRRARIFYSDAPESYVDQCLLKFANDLRAKANPTFANLATLNPWLADSVEKRARQNFAELLIFKSCDGGRSFTANDGNCVGDQTLGQGGQITGTGWRPYSVLKANERGEIQNTFSDPNVIGGRSYLYSLVTKTRGFSAAVRDIDVTGNTITRVLTISDTIYSSLQRSGPTTSDVYVPINYAAGSKGATFSVHTDSGVVSTVPLTIRVAGNATGGKYQLVFANRFTVINRRNLTTGTDSATVIAEEVLDTALVGTTKVPRFVYGARSFESRTAVAFSADPAHTVSAQSSTFTDTLNTKYSVTTTTISGGLGFVALDPTGKALFVSTYLTSTDATPQGFLGNPAFSGFFVGIDAPSAGAFVADSAQTIKASGDTIYTGVRASNVIFQDRTNQRATIATGLYELVFKGDPYGPGAPFKFDLTKPSEAQTAVTTSLAARAVEYTGPVSPRIAEIIKAAAEPGNIADYKDRPLVAGKFPFVAINRTTGKQAILVLPKRTSLKTPRLNSVLLGSGNDTLRVDVPEDVWVPGDEFLILEERERFQMSGNATVITGGKPTVVTDTVVAFAGALLGCDTTRQSCNPVQLTTLGATSYLPFQSGTRVTFLYNAPFTTQSVINIEVVPQQLGSTTFTKQDLARVRVVPNPYVVQSQFDRVPESRLGDPRIYFSGVPASGMIRIYTISGQLVQQIVWNPADLSGTGDLPYDLRTREGIDLASGLYIYVITATDTQGRKSVSRGKFGVIR